MSLVKVEPDSQSEGSIREEIVSFPPDMHQPANTANTGVMFPFNGGYAVRCEYCGGDVVSERSMTNRIWCSFRCSMSHAANGGMSISRRRQSDAMNLIRQYPNTPMTIYTDRKVRGEYRFVGLENRPYPAGSGGTDAAIPSQQPGQGQRQIFANQNRVAARGGRHGSPSGHIVPIQHGMGTGTYNPQYQNDQAGYSGAPIFNTRQYHM